MKNSPKIGSEFDATVEHNRRLDYLALLIGAVSIVTSLFIFFCLIEWSKPQANNLFNVTKMLFAFGIGLCAVTMTGGITTELKAGPLTVTAAKGFGIFVLVIWLLAWVPLSICK